MRGGVYALVLSELQVSLGNGSKLLTGDLSVRYYKNAKTEEHNDVQR